MWISSERSLEAHCLHLLADIMTWRDNLSKLFKLAKGRPSRNLAQSTSQVKGARLLSIPSSVGLLKQIKSLWNALENDLRVQCIAHGDAWGTLLGLCFGPVLSVCYSR